MNMERKSGIYMWTSPSGKSYIGQSVDLVKRYNSFISNCVDYGGEKINRARKKYNNKSDWKYKVLEYCDLSKLNEREIYYIRLYDTYHNGYNSSLGGESGSRGCKWSEESRNKINGRLPWNKGIKGSIKPNKTSFKKGQKPHNMKTVYQYTLDGTFIRSYGSGVEAEIITGVDRKHISLVCLGKRRSAGGFKWTYKNPPLLKKNEGLIKN